MKLLVGLGNPGARYQDTRHNVGFAVADELARRWGVCFEGSPAEALMARARQIGPGVTLVKPLTFMNLSGLAVAELVRYFRIDLADLLVVADDANLPLGWLRARSRGSDGGHNGLGSVAERLGTDQFARLRIGVGRGDTRRQLADHVLSRFQPDEWPAMAEAVARAADAAELFVAEGIDAVMNRYNVRSDQPDRGD